MHTTHAAHRYGKSRLVAVGGMARIYAAERRDDQRRVAIKVFQPERGHEEKFREYMVHEAHALTVGANPYVVELLGHGVYVGQPFLALEWIDGRTLSDAMATEAPLSLERAAALFRSILDAVDSLHARGVIHADLKPANVMLSPHHGEERVRLIDLGAACVNGSGVVQRDEIFGTLGYMPPEIATGRPLEPSSDVYATGVLLFQLLTGASPFPGTTMTDVIEQQLRSRLPRPSRLRLFAKRRVCDAVDAVLATALAPDPARRFVDIRTMRLAFDRAVGEDSPISDMGDAVPTDVGEAPTLRYARPWATVN